MFFLQYRLRLREGFTLAYNECGVVNLVKEYLMDNNQSDSNDANANDSYVDSDENFIGKTNRFPCLVQYVIFPSNIIVKDGRDNDEIDRHKAIKR